MIKNEFIKDPQAADKVHERAYMGACEDCIFALKQSRNIDEAITKINELMDHYI